MPLPSSALLRTVALGAALALPTAPVAAAILKLGHVYEPGHPMHVAALEAAEAMQACTGGGVTIEVYPASQLGSENALNEQIRFGGVDIIFTGQNFAASSYAPLAIGAAPYVFGSRDQALTYRTSEVFQDLWRGWEQATGQHVLSAAYFGAFNVSSNTPIHTPEDMRGLKVRVPDAPLYMAFPRAVGANPTPVAFAEVYLALQQGLVTASVNPLPVTYSHKFFEVQDYVALTGHLIEYVLWIAGDHVKGSLDEAQWACLVETSLAFGERATDLVVEEEDSLRARMEAEGLIEFTEPDIAAFQAITKDVVQELAKELGVPDGTLERIGAL